MAQPFVRRQALHERIDCSKLAHTPVLVKSRCGKSADCINDDRLLPDLAAAICGSIPWCQKHPTRTVEFWKPDGSRRMFTMNNRWMTSRILGQCGQDITPTPPPPGAASQQSPFTVNIPGVADIIKLPSLNTPKLRWERYQRFKNSRSALPDYLKWAPALLTKLDNAQDLLFTALALAWPLLKLIGPRMAGPLGILLTINDGLNLATCVLASATRMPGTKVSCLALIADTKINRRYFIKRASAFLLKFPWRGFAIQAPQALNSISIYGIQLGTIMGAITDLTWGLLRAPWNGMPRIQGPPPSDPLSKAARYLSTPPWHYYHSGLFTYEEHWLLSAADVVAAGILMQHETPYSTVAREIELSQTPAPHVEPWHHDTIALLAADGWKPLDDQRPPIPALEPRATYGEAMQAIAGNFDNWIETIRVEFPASDDATAFMLMLHQCGTEIFNWYTPGGAEIAPEFTFDELTIAHSFAYNIFPPEEAAPTQVAFYLQRCAEIAAGRGRDHADPADMQQAMLDAFGSWRQL